MKIGEEETPHEKAAYVQEAVELAINSLFINKPQERQEVDPDLY
jgi:hypothetical protein